MRNKKLGKKHDQCCVGSCSNNERYPHNVTKRGHVGIMKWHRFTSDPTKREQWVKLIGKGRENSQLGKWTYVCSNHFIDAQRTTPNLDAILFLTTSNQKKLLLKKKES